MTHIGKSSSNSRSMRIWLAACFAFLLSSCSLLRDQADPSIVSIRGIPPTLEQLNISTTAYAQDLVMNELIHTAGLSSQPAPGSPDWSLVMKAGVYEISRQCDQYLDVLFRFNRQQRAGRQDLAAAAAATGAIMGIAGATVEALAITAAGFGLASSLFDASVNSVLFTIEPSALRNVALQGRKKYLDELAKDNVRPYSRPDTLIILQGYLTQCSPAAIEANINNAASGAPSVVSPVPGVAEQAAALAAPSSTTLAPPPPPIVRPFDILPPENPNDPYATLTNEDFNRLRVLFGLGRFAATGPNSQPFKDNVKLFQQCMGKNPVGVLTRSELTRALEGDPKCLPTTSPRPPRIHRPIDILPPEDPNDPYSTLTNEDFNKLRVLFGLGQFAATSTNSPRFKDKVKSFQECLGKNPVGVLTRSELTRALEGDPKCLPTTAAPPPASQPVGSPVPQPSGPQPEPGGNQQPPPPPISR